ncbi:MAG: hypothetical protein ABI083_03910 [Lapillicoccus sp.]
MRLLALVLVAWLVWSIGGALLNPTGDSAAAKLAEWARDHQLGFVVNAAETLQYDANPPAVGGSASVPVLPPVAPGPVSAAALAAIVPPQMTTPAGPALAGEGTWDVLARVRGTPTLYGTFVRPDSTHTSYLAGVVSIDTRLVHFSLHPGTQDPGPGNWGSPTSVPEADRSRLLATFNGGFKIADAQGGFFLNGSTAGTLTPGAASIVFYRDGHVSVGVWGRDVGMAPDVVGVRQNLKLVIDHGVIPAAVDSNVETAWGASIGGKYFVWRSGLGVTADGRLIFVYGPALSVRSLADLLHRAGCVTAMQMEINPAWMSFMYYQPTATPTTPKPVKLLDSQERPADRYFTPTSRDFIEVTSS